MSVWDCPECGRVWPPDDAPIGDYELACEVCGREWVVERRRFPPLHPESEREFWSNLKRMGEGV